MLRQSSYVAIAAAGGLGFVFAGPAKSEFFSGPYIGVEGDVTSAVTFEQDWNLDEDGDEGVIEGDFAIEDPLSGGSVFAGWGDQEGGFFYGLEARYTLGDRDGKHLAGGEGDIGEGELGEGYSVSARLGSLLYDGTVMLYGSLGYAEREFTVVAHEDLEWSDDFSGYRAAVGMEYRPTGVPVSVRAEGSRSDLGGESVDQWEANGSEFDPGSKYDPSGEDEFFAPEAETDDLVENAFHVGVAYTFE
ncbi:hypothetical protein HH1059_16460 [Halorhodospira halochloris]|uniref:Uncharacterized protein n=1 Tax=Halorhodospira halochloris TaxID=1052 RepID=A0A0X8XA93_HALHR|nr:outer membrane beta-barrel protein [Halorhodospira halochloris]MBK1652222.1 hypothetical protein [Halorhodospira halochloris]BAU58356.1 hypothetical protein HH1059_16460 [Halorhodospira halochloris]